MKEETVTACRPECATCVEAVFHGVGVALERILRDFPIAS